MLTILSLQFDCSAKIISVKSSQKDISLFLFAFSLDLLFYFPRNSRYGSSSLKIKVLLLCMSQQICYQITNICTIDTFSLNFLSLTLPLWGLEQKQHSSRAFLLCMWLTRDQSRLDPLHLIWSPPRPPGAISECRAESNS